MMSSMKGITTTVEAVEAVDVSKTLTVAVTISPSSKLSPLRTTEEEVAVSTERDFGTP
jgi:hypothetical protein